MTKSKLSLKIMTLLIAALSCAWVSNASAMIVLDFEPPEFSRDASKNVAHTYAAVDGDVHFDGRVWYILDDDPIVDHTTGTTDGSFWKNTNPALGGIDKITMSFDKEVTSLNFWAYGFDNIDYTIRFYDSFNTVLLTDNLSLTEAWTEFDYDGFSAPLASYEISSSTGLGNNVGIDDISASPVPEPASIFLLGSGLVGVVALRRKKQVI